MAVMRIVGAALVVLSVPLVIAAILLLFSDSSPVPVFIQDDPTLSGFAAAGAGAVAFLAGIVLLIMGPRQAQKKARGVVIPTQPQVEIKRTEMNWGAAKAVSPTDELQERLDDVNQRMGQLKVQFGMGQVSNESYKVIMADLEKEKSNVERRILELSR